MTDSWRQCGSFPLWIFNGAPGLKNVISIHNMKVLCMQGFEAMSSSEVGKASRLTLEVVSRLAFSQLQSDVRRDALPTCLNGARIKWDNR